MTDLVYLNGDFVPAEQACLPIRDRGILFGDSIYEVVPAYGGKPFRAEQHLNRLDRSLSAIRMSNPLTHAQWHGVFDKLLSQSPGEDQSVYLQVTRGDYPTRSHRIPDTVKPNVFAYTSTMQERNPAIAAGIRVITVNDIRWRRCDIKATTLLANVLAQADAKEHQAHDAIMIRDGEANEGTASNLFIVSNGLIITPPDGDQLLPGVTRDLVLEMAQQNGLPYAQASITVEDLETADEIWLTSSTIEIAPVITLNGEPVANGEPGPIWTEINRLFQDCKTRLRATGKCY